MNNLLSIYYMLGSNSPYHYRNKFLKHMQYYEMECLPVPNLECSYGLCDILNS